MSGRRVQPIHFKILQKDLGKGTLALNHQSLNNSQNQDLVVAAVFHQGDGSRYGGGQHKCFHAPD